MPPSPALRSSPGRRLRAENHKRGHSLESGLLLKEKDEDLALFNQMQSRERDNFLLHPADDFDVFFSTKLRYFSDFKLGISIPVRGESSDLLNADGEKKDYDWLLTPPDTPLFPSLDDETPPVNLAHRGRPRSQPISISKSTTMDKSYSASRSSASPHRLSPSPRSGNSTFQSRGSPSSAPYSSPRSAMLSRRPSPPPNRPSTPAPRSSTPIAQSMSTGSSATVASSGTRGTSPVNTSRGNSASPKLRAWQSNLPGFSLDAPPNLRTSLADRPASYVRGSSPASRKGRDSSSKFGRQSMSPTASRSAGSSYSHEQDQFSSHSKGSVASSGDDDIDSLQSVSVGTSHCSDARKVGALPNNRVLVSSKKPARTLSSSSAPKRSSDSALRQMEHRRSPQIMFRPLLSSVPSTTFYVGKDNSAHHPMISRVTTSSNASSEQGASIAPDTEESDHDQDDMASELGKAPFPDAQDEVFVFDKVEEVNEDVGHCDFDEGTKIEVEPGESEEFCSHNAATATYAITSESKYVDGDSSEVVCRENMASCSKCGNKFRVIKRVEGNDDLCPNCCEKDGCLTVAAPRATIIVIENSAAQSEMTSEESSSFDELDPVICVPELPETSNSSEARLAQHGKDVEQGRSFNVEQSCLPGNSLARSMVEEGEKSLVDQQVVGQPIVGSSLSDSDTADQQLPHFNVHPSLKVDVSEVAGISVLLKRSSSTGPVVQGRAFTATNIHYDDPSYARDSMNSMRSSIWHGSISASSSVDLSSSKQIEIRVQRQLSGRRADVENYWDDVNAKPRSTGSSFSGISNHAYQALILAKRTSDKNFTVPIQDVGYEALEEIPLVTQNHDRALENTELHDKDTPFIRTAVLEEDKFKCTEHCRTVDASVSELSSSTVRIRLNETSVAAFPKDEDCISSGTVDDFPNNAKNISDTEVSAMTPGSSFRVDDAMLNCSLCEMYVVEDPTSDSLVTISGELENGHESTPSSQTNGVTSPNSKSIIHELQKPSVVTPSEKHISVSAQESSISDYGNGILEESTVTIEGRGGNKARSLALEETDTILFCSSIIHDLVYQAATIGMEKENLILLEGSWPTVTILGKSSSDWKDPRGRTTSKRTLKSQKASQRRVETEMKTPSTKTETDVKTNESLTHDAGVINKVDSKGPPQKLESKCNCTVM